MRLVIVPTSVSVAINRRLDAAYLLVPEAEIGRESHFKRMLDYFEENGFIPEFIFERIMTHE